MEHLYIEPSGRTPEVFFNIDDSKLCILGRSFPEDVSAFYLPIGKWLKNNIVVCVECFNMEIQLEYFNTTSSKYLLEMMRIIEDYKKKHDVPVAVHWKYFSNDEDMKESGMEYQQFVSIPFVFEEVRKNV